MGFKEKILILTLLLFLIIGGVAASDDNQTGDAIGVAEDESSVAVTTEAEDTLQIVDESSAEDIELSDEINETEESEAVEMDSAVSVSSASSREVLGANNDEEILGAGLNQLAQRIWQGRGGSVELTQDYIAVDRQSYGRTNIFYDVHVYGNNHVLDADERGYIIVIQNGASNVVFEDVIFQNAAVSGNRYGSAVNILTGATVTFINCQFINNSDSDYGGGAIYARYDCNCNFINCTFTNNTGDSYNGGAIYSTNDQSTFNLTGCNFKGNSAANGGAIYVNSNNKYTITNCTFEDNTATGSGGAIYVNSADAFTVSDSTFDANNATTSGGAIYATTTNNAVISNNTVFTDNAAAGNGGSIYWTGSSDLTIQDVTVDGSTAEGHGGAFYLVGTDMTVDNVTFSQTTSNSGQGGAIYANADVSITDSSFDSFTSSGEGTAISFAGGSSTVSNSEFAGNNAILVDSAAVASLIENTITDINSEDGYAVSNKGTLSLSKNNFDDVIVNAGDIETQTYTIVLNNQTLYVDENTEVTLNATIEDDNGNTIVVSDTFYFVDNEGNNIEATYSNRYYYATFTAESGVYVIGASESISGLNMNSLKTGTIVTKQKTEIELDVTQVNEGEKVTIVATLTPEDATNPYEGNVTFKVGDNEYTIDVSEGAATLVLNNLSADTYALTATYSGDNYHSNATNSTYFIVNLYKTQISVSVDDILYGQNATAIVTTNANGTAVLILNGRKEVEIVNGTASLNFTDLEPGEYSITVVYSENGYYESAYNYTNFTVYKNSAAIESIDFERVVAYGANNTITVTMGNVTEGSLIIEVNGHNYTVPIENSVAVLNVSLPVGKDYTVKAYFTGDNHFNATSKEADYTFEVTDKNVTVISITVDKVVEIDTENVNVTIKTNSSADLTVYVNDVNTTVNKSGDTYWFIADTSVAGTYTISAMTAENENYASGYNLTTFTVIKHNSTVSVEVGEEFEVGSEFTITVTSNSTVNVTINGKTYAVNDDGTVDIDTTTLKAGEYIVTATVYESDKFYGNALNKTFTITKHDAVIDSVEVTPSVQIGQNVTVTVTMGNVSEGTVIIEVDGVNYSVPITDSEAELTFTTTKIGNGLPVNVYYLGDESYNAAESKGYSFNVTGKYDAVINITAPNGVVDELLYVLVTTNSSAAPTVELNGEIQPLTKTGETYWFAVNSSVVGTYTVVAKTAENEYYYAGYNSTTFEIFKHNSTVSIDVNESYYVGSTFTITVTSNTTANVTINGKTYAVDENGNVVIVTAELAAGEYTVTATVFESDKYYANSTSATFNIVRYNSEIVSVVVSPDTTQIGQNVTVTVEMANVTEGTVVIEVNGANYTVDITDGVAILTVATTEIGNNFPVKAYFLGDYMYNASSKVGNTFNVTGKYNTEIIITASDVLIDGNLNVTIQTNTTAPITVKVNGKTQEVNKTGDVYWFIADTSAAGNYTVIASSEETEFYYAGYNSTTFNVIKLNSTAAIDVDSPHYVGDSFTITVTNNTAVNVTINGKTCSVKADGTVDIDTTTLAAGEYTVTAVVYENDKYYGNSTTATFNIVKYSTEIASIDFLPVVGVGYNNTIVVTMANVTEGSLIIEVAGVNYTVSIADKVAKLNVSLPVGEDYNVKAYFLGDDMYNATSKDGGSFDVTDKNVTVIAIEVAEVVVIDSENVIVTVTTNSTAPITVQVNGVNQTVALVDGHYEFTADTSVAGTYTITAMTAENADYAAGYNVTTFKVIKHNSTVEIEVGEEYTVGSEFTIKVSTNSTAAVTVNGKTYAIKDDGTVDIDTTVLAAGEYTVIATVTENDKYYGNTTSKTFTIVKYDSVIDSVVVSPESTEIGQNVTVTVTMGNVVEGTLIIDVAGVNYSVPITDGVAVLTIPTTQIGNDLPVAAYFLGDENYYASSKSGNTFNVTGKYDAVINITAPDGVVDELLYVLVTTNSSAAPTVELNGEIQPFTKTGETYWFAVDTSVAGTYTVVAKTAENEYYYAGYNSTTFEIFKHNSTVSIEVNESYHVGDTFKIKVTNNTEATVTVNGVTYTVDAEGYVDIVTAALPAGEYIVTAAIAENDKYYANSTSKTFSIIKYDAEIASVDLKPSVSVDYQNTITVTMGNVTSGSLIIEVNGVNYTVAIVDKVAQLNVSLPVGENYPVNVYFMGDMKYNPVNSTGYSFDVTDKNVTAIVIDVESVVVVDSTLTVNVTTNTTANLFVYVNGEEITLTKVNDTTYSFTADTSAAGTYTIIAISLENMDYESAYNSTTYRVIKINSTVSIEVNENNYVGDDFTITVTNNTAVSVTINGVSYSVNADGTVNIDTTQLAAGEYIVTAVITENDKYCGNATNRTFTISKLASGVNVTGDAVSVGETAVVEIAGPADYNGNAVVTVNGTDYSVTLTDGAGKLNITGLANGTYEVKVTLSENDKYLESTNDSAVIYVSKVESTIDASAENITVGDLAVIKVTLPEDATGNVTVVIGDITKTVPVSGGENEIAVDGVPVGEYDVSVTYNGDGKYEPSSTALKLNVSQVVVNPEDIKVIDQGNGTVVVVIADNATGNVTVKIGDNEYNASVADGIASVDLVNETPGQHDITVVYSGDENHTDATTAATVTIPKLETPISIDVDNSYAGDVSEIIVTLPENATGSVTIEIDGVNYTKTIDSTGKATFEITGLAAGNKTVVAIYAGDDTYVANSTTAQFKVEKLESTITVSAEVLDNTAIITVSDLPEDATGIVTVTVGDTDYSINLTSTNQVTVPILKSGTYDVVATYLGDDRYLGNSNTTSFKATIDDVAIEVQNETYGETVTVKVTVPDDATGNVTVTLGNKTVTVPVTGGENVITVDNVSAGTYDINVTYSGDDQYSSKTVNDTVYVYSSINAENIKRGWNSVYDYKAEFLDSQGRVLKNTDVQYIVNGKTYTVTTDSQGIAYLSVPLDVGTYEITSVNPVTGEEVTMNLTIVKRLLENKDITMDFMDGTYYRVLAIGDDGNPVGEGEFIDIYVNTIHYSCRTDKNGYAVLKINLNPNTYTVRSEYKLTKVTNKLVVKQTLKLVKKTVTVKKGKKLVLQAKLAWSNGKAIKGKVIKFKFKGKTYKAKTNSKGIAKVTIKAKITKKLKKGKTYTYTATYIKNKVKGKVKVK